MFAGGDAFVAGAVPDARMSLADAARLMQLAGGGLAAHGSFISPPPPHDAGRVENHPLPAWNTPSFHAHAAEIAVDGETGEVTVARYVVAQDVGFAINPAGIEGQIEGGVAQGLGQALSEEIVFDGDGRVANATLTDYKMPTALDVPPIASILVEHASQAGPYGAKGVGEPTPASSRWQRSQTPSPRQSASASPRRRSPPKKILRRLDEQALKR